MMFRFDIPKWIKRRHMCIGRRVSAVHEVTKSPDHQEWAHPIYVSRRIQDRKSTFLAHASILPSPAALPNFLEYLTSLSSLKRATHHMYAYRTSLQAAEKAAGQNDGGENGSGERLAHLLQLSECENVVVVVSRWYGGVKLGSDRWKRISDVAKDALEKGSFLKRQYNNTSNHNTKHRKKRKY